MAKDDSDKIAAAIKQVQDVLSQQTADENLNEGMKRAAAPFVKLFAEDIERRRADGATESDIDAILDSCERMLTSQCPPDQLHVVMGELRRSIGR